MENSFHEYVI